MLNDDVSNRAASLDSYRERITNFSNEFDLGLFLYIVKRSLVWIALCLLLAFAAAWIYLRYTAPNYESKAVLQFGQSNTAEKVLKVSELVEGNNLTADVELLRSRYFVAKALRRIPLQVSYFFKGQILTTEFYSESFFVVDDVVLMDSTILDIPIMMEVMENSVNLTYTKDGKVFSDTYPVGRIIATPHFRCSIRPRDGQVMEAPREDGKLYFVFNNPESLVSRFRGQLNIGIADPTAKTVYVTCRDHNALLARDVAQSLADAFIAYDVERKSESAKSILAFIETQKDTVFKQLAESEIQMQAFKKDYRVSDMENIMPLLLERSSEYENQIVSIMIEDDLLASVEKSTRSKGGELDVYELIPLLVGTTYEQTLSELIKGLQQMLDRRQLMVFDAKESNVMVTTLDGQIDMQRKLILASIATMRSRLAEKKNSLTSQIAQYDARFLTPAGETGRLRAHSAALQYQREVLHPAIGEGH